MIKITRINSGKVNAPKLFLIPGGPGLSSNTLRNLDLLKRSVNLFYVDFSGTNDNPYTGKKTFAELSTALKEIIQAESGEKFILGHSFGGFFAADIFIKANLCGLFCLSTPFSQESLAAAGDNYSKHKTQILMEAEKEWAKNQDDSSFSKWLSEYGELYFKNKEGKALLLNDKVSSAFFKANRSDAMELEVIIPKLANHQGVKVFICGSEDKLLPPDILKRDSDRAGFKFFEINNASHFVSVDQPEEVASLIEKCIATLIEGE